MAKTDTTSALFPEIPTLFGAGAFGDGWKTWASFGSRLSGLTLETASKSTDIATDASKETISNLRFVTTIRDGAPDYAKAYGGFVQTQMDLTRRTAEALFGLARMAGTEASELLFEAGGSLTETATASANEAASKAKKAT